MLDWARRIYVQLAYPLAEGLQGLIRQAGRQAGVAQKELRRFTHGGVGRGGAAGIASHETRKRMEERTTHKPNPVSVLVNPFCCFIKTLM